MSNSDSPQVELARKWHEVFEKRDAKDLEELLHNDFVYTVFPSSLHMREQKKTEWCEMVRGMIGTWTHMDHTTYSTIEAPGKVITHYSGEVKTKLGVDIDREAICIITVADEDGNLKIKRVDEFIDSKVHLEGTQAIEAARMSVSA